MVWTSQVLCHSLLGGALLFVAASAETSSTAESSSAVPCEFCLALQEDVERDDQPVLLLQRHGVVKAKAESSPISRRLAAATPIYWVHVPKCGSSFLNTLVHLPGICPGLPEDLYISSATFGPAFLDGWMATYDVRRVCPGLMLTMGHNGIEGPIGPGYEAAKGHYMIMLRQPEERLISAYHDLAKAVQRDPTIVRRKDRSWGDWPLPEVPPLDTYAAYAAGCATRMLTQWGWACGGRHGPPSPGQVEEAKRRLSEGFAFVGLTDEWSLSICLFSRMFKVPCHKHQFSNTRPSKADDSSKSLDGLKGYKDPYDGALYDEAKRLFYGRLKRYNVSEESCEPCWREAEILEEGSSLASVRAKVRYEDEDASAGVNASRSN